MESLAFEDWMKPEVWNYWAKHTNLWSMVAYGSLDNDESWMTINPQGHVYNYVHKKSLWSWSILVMSSFSILYISSCAAHLSRFRELSTKLDVRCIAWVLLLFCDKMGPGVPRGLGKDRWPNNTYGACVHLYIIAFQSVADRQTYIDTFSKTILPNYMPRANALGKYLIVSNR